MSTLASTLLLFLNHTHISKKGTASECQGSAGVFRWGMLALALLCVPRLQQAWGAFARGDSLELNIVVNGIQQIAEGPRKLPVLQASRSCDHGPDTIRAGAMSARRSDARLPGRGRLGLLTGRSWPGELTWRGRLWGQGVQASLRKLWGKSRIPQTGYGLSSPTISGMLITTLGHTRLSVDDAVELPGGKPHQEPQRAPSRK